MQRVNSAIYRYREFQGNVKFLEQPCSTTVLQSVHHGCKYKDFELMFCDYLGILDAFGWILMMM